MTQKNAEPRRWNLFARELEDLLRKRGCNLNDLMHEGLLHREKVRRLKQSLVVPRFHLLSPEDLDLVVETFQVTGDEHLRLRAAILATAVEETLMDRIDAENALQAAEEIFPLLLTALQQRFKQQRGLAATRKALITDEVTTDDVLDPLLQRFDHALLALHLSRQGKMEAERIAQARIARDRFLLVLAELEALCATDPSMGQDEAWQIWHQETRKGLAAAEEILS
ncbi:hypothetical protein [Dictyobacter kobayashii]|uniref:Uncharacterized protein n=1 Tax=Dictyobacter kobayashii TaxID=2014872 RepID=A0A402AU06_9CHLR|nr:hypothetical protein [Dictyobacter kobayashii]GCE22523.1 hypothetical protein KDK_63230 [Dictyobacter kobayashii]